MKKIISLVLFLTISVGLYAQKSYVTVFCRMIGGVSPNYPAYLSGDIPTSMKSRYDNSDFASLGNNPYYWIGIVLNLLAKEGFVVEQMNTNGENNFVNYLLSRPSDNSTSNNVRMTKVIDDDSDVYEVARYNLQGMPVNESEKGFQIIVYSNFTTKTIIKE